MSDLVMRHEMSDVVMIDEMSDMWWDWHEIEKWIEWHEIETEMIERHPETLVLSFWAEWHCGLGLSYCEESGQKSPVKLCDN